MLYVAIFFVGLFIVLRYVRFFQVKEGSVWLMPFGFALKTAIGFFFIYLYSFHYGDGELTADASAFMEESKMVQEVMFDSPSAYFKLMFGLDDHNLVCDYIPETTQWEAGSSKWINDTKTILRLHSIIHFFSFNQIGIHLMVVVVIALIGLKWMAESIKKFAAASSNWIFLGLLLMPNTLFWSSGLLKEPLIYFSLGLFLWTCVQHLPILKKISLLLVASTLLIAVKPYLLVCIILALAGYWIFTQCTSVKMGLLVLIFAIVGAFASLFTRPLSPVVQKISDQQFDFNNIGRGGVFARGDTCIYIIPGDMMHYAVVDRVDSTVYLTHSIIGDYIEPNTKENRIRCRLFPNKEPWGLHYDGDPSGSYVEMPLIEGSVKQLIKNVPLALATTFLRPSFNDPPHSKLKILSMVDAYGLLVLFIVVLIFFRREMERKEVNLIVALCLFSLVLALLIGWTTPVLGAVIRYKVPIQLAMMMITCIVLKPEKLKR